MYKAFDGKNTPDDIAKAWLDSKASKKAVALLSPDGSHVVIGEAKRQARGGTGYHEYVVTYDANGKIGSRRFSVLHDEGWKLVGAVKFDHAAKNYAATYSIQEWNKLAGELLLERQGAAIGGIEPVSEAEATEVFGQALRRERKGVRWWPHRRTVFTTGRRRQWERR